MSNESLLLDNPEITLRIKRLAKKEGARDWRAYGAKLIEKVLQQAMGERDLTIKDVCAQLNVSRVTVFRWKAEGRFPGAYMVNQRVLRIPREDVEALRARRERL